MRVLHLEDDAMKYANIQRVLNRGGVTDIVWETQLQTEMQFCKSRCNFVN